MKRSRLFGTGFAVSMIAASLCLSSVEQATASEAEQLKALRDIASNSNCASRNWKKRGIAPRSYIEGIALVFARAVCEPERDDVKVVSAALDASSGSDDALAVYKNDFTNAHISNETAGVDTLRHSYLLLLGLGIMESSGKYCEGRDVSQCFTTAESAEAGLFQTSFGAKKFSSVLLPLTQSYSAGQPRCLLNVFQGSIVCKTRRSHNPQCPSATSGIAGTGPGADWQRLTKSCPAFATEYAAVVLRKHGGPRGEFNPIRKRQVEIPPECADMLQKVQTYVNQHPEACLALK